MVWTICTQQINYRCGDSYDGGIYREVKKYSAKLGGHKIYYVLMVPDNVDQDHRKAEDVMEGPCDNGLLARLGA